MTGLTAWQGLFEHGRLQAGQSVLVHGAAGAVGSMATQLARGAGAHVIGTGRAAGRQTALDFGAHEFVDLDNDTLEDVGGVDLVIDVVVISDRAQLSEIAQRVRDGRLRSNIGTVAALDDAVAAFNPTERIKGKTIIRSTPRQ
jgi:NADPH:quinone reductase-like Zn-dependent oxidoreductase